MKLTRIAALTTMALLSTSLYAAQLKTQTDKLSYTIGVDLGKNFKKQNITVNPDLVRQGMKDATSGSKLKMTSKQMEGTLKSFQASLVKKKQAAFQDSAQKNKAQGEAFLAKNKKNKDVKTLANGLQYKVIKAGSGKQPSLKDTVVVKYTGRLINGTVFDSTEKTGKPVTFKVSEVIPGWTQALQLMPVGSSWEVYIPSQLAYGAQGIGGPIGPNETLIFQIQLLAIKNS